MPYFGEYQIQREAAEAELKLKLNPLDYDDELIRPAAELTGIPVKLADVVGRALSHIGTYKDLDNKKQVVALIDDDMCINCGKCYMVCADSGYQAIEFDPDTHIPKVNHDCTGCTLCLSVCPIIDCIT